MSRKKIKLRPRPPVWLEVWFGKRRCYINRETLREVSRLSASVTSEKETLEAGDIMLQLVPTLVSVAQQHPLLAGSIPPKRRKSKKKKG
jgi:hypothetical protein